MMKGCRYAHRREPCGEAYARQRRKEARLRTGSASRAMTRASVDVVPARRSLLVLFFFALKVFGMLVVSGVGSFGAGRAWPSWAIPLPFWSPI